MNKRYAALLLMVSLALLIHAPTVRAEARTMAITPFTITSESGLAYLETGLIDLFSSRIALKNQIDIVDKARTVGLYQSSDKPPQERILDVGRQTQADFILTGSLDESVKGVVLRAFVIETQTGKPVLELSEKSGQYESTDAVIPLVNLISARINRDLFSRDIPENVAPKKADTPFNIYAHPDKLLEFVPKKTKK